MNADTNFLIRSLAPRFLIPLIALSLVGCSAIGKEVSLDSTTPEIASTPTGLIELLPTATIAPTATLVPPESSVPATESLPPSDWVQESYGDAWTIGYPASWTVNAAGAHEGALQLHGEYEGHSYLLTFSYPIGIFPETLEEWVDEMLLPLSLDERNAVIISDVVVGNTPAKKVVNVVPPDGSSLAHYVYIWRNENKNPRLITLTQSDGQPVDSVAMERLLDQLLAFIE